ncbi:type II inositol 3,4-bisphosphate 4-phosphatase-like [Oppia nitens]|uniref:type II inositol 3,4-bisphosphate 4-phosphatase-like n=1 Tax=Oppia nitens TaxID=1686743 RepID=UPI0023DC8104|nr:type II inositol 3,4-bisphosphate 4-phosphatase-like [Oppia nitens]
MHINVDQLTPYLCGDSHQWVQFDREGYLFVKYRNDRQFFNQWKSESFVERFVRLKGNILVIIATKTLNDSTHVINKVDDRCLNIIVLEEFNVRVVDESDKYYEFVIDLNRNDLIRSIHFATISHQERDEWVECIHLSGRSYLISLHTSLVNQLNQLKIVTNYETSDDITNYRRRDSSIVLSVSCDYINASNNRRFRPNFVIFIYYKTITNSWQLIGKTETLCSRNPRFEKCLIIPQEIHESSTIKLKFNLYDIIETLTNTKCLLCDSYLKCQTNDYKTVHRIDLKSIINKQTIGILAVKLIHHSFNFDQTLYRIKSLNCIQKLNNKLMTCLTYSMGEVKTEYQRNQMRALECHLRLVNILTESLNEISLYQSQHSFRPSTAKSEQFLQFIPINFHLQRCRVTDSNANRQITRDVFTVGAYCSHYFGFGSGGMKRELSDLYKNDKNANNLSLLKTWKSMVNFFRISSLRDIIYNHLKCMIDCIDCQTIDKKLVFNNFSKVEEFCKEIVTILSSQIVEESIAFCEKVRNQLEVTNSGINTAFDRSSSLQESRRQSNHNIRDFRRYHSLTSDDHQELEPIDLIHLNIKASVISINSKLIANKSSLLRSDLNASEIKLKSAIESLLKTSSICYASCALSLDRQQIERFYCLRLRRDMIFTQVLTSLVIATLSQLSDQTFLKTLIQTKTLLSQHEVLLSCYAEEVSMLEDMEYSLNQINCCVKFIFENSIETNIQPKIEGNSFDIRVTFYCNQFEGFENKIECNVLALLFNIGINEYATLAETLGSVKLQETINKDSYMLLDSYVKQTFINDSNVSKLMVSLKSEIWSNRVKNIRVLHLVQQIVNHLNGIRFTSCKSAKDRTSMAVTLEEARLCAQFFNISEINEIQWFQTIIDTLRSEGTRRENTRKNVGIAKYAFNSLQLMTFPKLLRAPNGTYSSIET